MVNEAKGNSDETLSLLSELSKVTEDEVLKEKIAHFVEEERGGGDEDRVGENRC